MFRGVSLTFFFLGLKAILSGYETISYSTVNSFRYIGRKFSLRGGCVQSMISTASNSLSTTKNFKCCDEMNADCSIKNKIFEASNFNLLRSLEIIKNSQVPVAPRMSALWNISDEARSLADSSRVQDLSLLKQCLTALLCVLGHDTSALMRHEAAYSIGQLGPRSQSIAPSIIAGTTAALRSTASNVSEHAMVRHEAAEALAALGEQQSSSSLCSPSSRAAVGIGRRPSHPNNFGMSAPSPSHIHSHASEIEHPGNGAGPPPPACPKLHFRPRARAPALPAVHDRPVLINEGERRGGRGRARAWKGGGG